MAQSMNVMFPARQVTKNWSLYQVRKHWGINGSSNHVLCRQLHGPPKVNEYSDAPLYPEIPKFKNAEQSDRFKAKEFMKKLETVEEKQFHLNRPKMYGWYSYILNSNWIPPDSQDFVQYATKTHIIDGKMPPRLSEPELEQKAKQVLSELAPALEQLIASETRHQQLGCTVPNDLIPLRDQHAVFWNNFREEDLARIQGEMLTRKIHGLIHSHLLMSNDHLANAVEDVNSRNEAFWFRGGILPDKMMIKKREGTKKLQQRKKDNAGTIVADNVRVFDEKDVMAPVERSLQFKHANVVQLRSTLPLEPFVEFDDELVQRRDFPKFEHDPRVLGFSTECQHAVNTPGYWAHDACQLGLLSYHSRGNNYNRQAVGSSHLYDAEVLKAQDLAKSILCNFGWLLPQACHLGFSPMTELTFPLCNQSVSTDGRLFSFYAYQLNTCDLSEHELEESDQLLRQNLLWADCGPEHSDGKFGHALFSSVDSDGAVKDFNPDCLKTLIKMYLNEPKARTYSMTPYLGEVGHLSNFPETYQRNFLSDRLKNHYSRRNVVPDKPETYLWEKILQIDNNMLPHLGTRRRRWWQMYKIDFMGKEHWHPEFVWADEKVNRYIPKGYREPWQRKKGLGRRYSKFAPKLNIPLQESATVYSLTDTKYKGEDK